MPQGGGERGNWEGRGGDWYWVLSGGEEVCSPATLLCTGCGLVGKSDSLGGRGGVYSSREGIEGVGGSCVGGALSSASSSSCGRNTLGIGFGFGGSWGVAISSPVGRWGTAGRWGSIVLVSDSNDMISLPPSRTDDCFKNTYLHYCVHKPIHQHRSPGVLVCFFVTIT